MPIGDSRGSVLHFREHESQSLQLKVTDWALRFLCNLYSRRLMIRGGISSLGGEIASNGDVAFNSQKPPPFESLSTHSGFEHTGT